MSLQWMYQPREAPRNRHAFRCPSCEELLGEEGGDQAPHRFLFYEGGSRTSPTASRFSCLVCSTYLNWEDAGKRKGWTPEESDD